MNAVVQARLQEGDLQLWLPQAGDKHVTMKVCYIRHGDDSSEAVDSKHTDTKAPTAADDGADSSTTAAVPGWATRVGDRVWQSSVDKLGRSIRGGQRHGVGTGSMDNNAHKHSAGGGGGGGGGTADFSDESSSDDEDYGDVVGIGDDVPLPASVTTSGGAGGGAGAAPSAVADTGATATATTATATATATATTTAVHQVGNDLWAHVWVTSVIMCEMLLSMGESGLLAGVSAFELGAGSSMNAAAAVMAGAKDMLATDISAAGLAVAARTATLNHIRVKAGKDLVSDSLHKDGSGSTTTSTADGSSAASATGGDGGEASFRIHDWNDLKAAPNGACDLVIGSDVLYMKPSLVPIARTIAQALTSEGVAVITDPGRVLVEDFVDTCRDVAGLQVRVHEVRFVRTATTTIPRLVVIVLGHGPLEDKPLAAAIAQRCKYYEAHRAGGNERVSQAKTCVFSV